MSVAETILQQLGGQRFTAMTGSKNYLADGNSLRMTLAKNHSKANRLTVTLDEATDTYRMHFYKYTPGHLNKKTFEWVPDKVVEVAEFDNILRYAAGTVYTDNMDVYQIIRKWRA